MENKIKYTIFLLLLINIFGCGPTEKLTKELDVHEDSYRLIPPYSQNIDTQFGLYYFKVGEERPIMANGFYPENNIFTNVYVTGTSYLSAMIGNGPNMYNQYVSSPTGYEFTTPIYLTAPYVAGDTWCSVNASSSSRNFVLRTGSDRKYNITYNCMVDNDIFDEGNDFEDKLNEAFAEANTTIAIQNNNLSITTELLPYTPIFFEWPNVINSFFKNRGIVPLDPQNNTVYLIGCKDVAWPNPQSPDFYGLSSPPGSNYNGTNNYRIICVLVNHILNLQVWNELYRRRQFITLTTIHELGHARGMNFTYSGGYQDGDITNDLHDFGHNGVLKNYCLMKRLVDYYPNNMTEFNKILDASKFCYGHLQMLFNAEW